MQSWHVDEQGDCFSSDFQLRSINKYAEVPGHVLKERNQARVQGRSGRVGVDLSAHNHKVVDSERFKAYVRAKLLVNSKVTRGPHLPQAGAEHVLQHAEIRAEAAAEVPGTVRRPRLCGDQKRLEPTKGKGFNRHAVLARPVAGR